MLLMPLMSLVSLSHTRCRTSCTQVSELAGKNSEWQVEFFSTYHSGSLRKNKSSDPVFYFMLACLQIHLSQMDMQPINSLCQTEQIVLFGICNLSN